MFKTTVAYDKTVTNTSGVYIIRSLFLKKEWKIAPVYIGSGQSIRRRIINHFCQLRKKKHCNTVLQNFYNKYGEENFEVDILEICSISKTVEQEQYYLNQFTPFADLKRGFNIAHIAESSQRGKKWSQQLREKILKQRATPEYKKKKDKAYQHLRKQFTLYNPFGKKVNGIGLCKFCKDNNLCVADISALLKGKVPSVKGWRLTLESKIHKRSKEFKIISPDGKLIQAKNITKFAKEHNLEITNLRAVIYGKRVELHGWKPCHVLAS